MTAKSLHENQKIKSIERWQQSLKNILVQKKLKFINLVKVIISCSFINLNLSKVSCLFS